MKMLKKVISVICVSALLLSGVGCSSSKDTNEETTILLQESKDTEAVISESSATEEIVKPENYPTKNIDMIVPAAAGSASDLLSRDFINYLDLGKFVKITNRDGAGQTIGSSEVARAKGDGYTLLSVGTSGLFNKPIQLGLDYSVNDFRIVAILQDAPSNIIVASPKSGYTSWEQVVEAAKAGKEITYSTGVAGSVSHLAILELLSKEGIDLKFVPYNGSGEVSAALEGGHLDIACLVNSGNIDKCVEGQLVPLFTFSDERLNEFKNEVPCSGEYDINANNYLSYSFLCVPATTPDDIYNYIKAKTDEVLQNPDYIAAREKSGNGPAPLWTAEEYKEFASNTLELYTQLSQNAGLIKTK